MSEYEWTRNALVTYCLLTLVFLSSWTDINGIFAELPQIILTQPEGWKLGTYLALITNLGNIAPLILVLWKCYYRKKSLDLVPINYVIILIGMSACFLLIIFWRQTSVVRNQHYSISLLILALFLSLLDCTSSISFADYVQKYSRQFTSALFLGESLTSIVPSLLAAAQGNGHLDCVPSPNGTQAIYQTARFSVSVYFFCLFTILTISFVSFIILQWTSVAKNARSKTTKSRDETDSNCLPLESWRLSRTSYVLLSLGCVYTSSILFGMLLSISTYVLMPYGHQIFYLGTILSPWMFTVIWILGIKKPLISKRFLLLFILIGSIGFAFELYIALKSPCPMWVGSIKGSVTILIVWLITYVLLGYPRLVIANYVRNSSSSGMFWYGVHVQIGALLGSIAAYLLVEIYSLFRERTPCEVIQC